MAIATRNEAAGRYESLDGLRGVAALTVVFHHGLLVVPELASESTTGISLGGQILKFSPAHALWLGSEAVWLFFILSGFVLALPYLRSRSLDLKAYYPRRIIRIYIPAVAALAFAFALALFVPRPDSSHSEWMQVHVDQPLPQTLADAALIFGGSPLNTPLWSLQWEVIYSLVLPLVLVVLARPTRHWPWIVALILGLIVAGGFADITALFLMPMFLLGCVLAANWDDIDRRSRRMLDGRGGSVLGWSLLGASLLSLTLKWIAAPYGLPGIVNSAAQGSAIAGIVVIFVLSVTWGPLRRFLTRRIVRWLGVISFSLYLTHEPIVVALGVMVGAGYEYLVVLLALPASLLVGWAFYTAIERPSHRLAQVVGRAIREPKSDHAVAVA